MATLSDLGYAQPLIAEQNAQIMAANPTANFGLAANATPFSGYNGGLTDPYYTPPKPAAKATPTAQTYTPSQTAAAPAASSYVQSPSNYYPAQPAAANTPTAATYPTPAAVSPYQSAQAGQAAWDAITAQNAQSAQDAQKSRDAYGNTLMNNYDASMNAHYGSAALPGGRQHVPVSGVGKDWPELKTLVNSMTAYDAANAPAPTTGAQRAAAVNAQPSSQFTSATQMRDYSNSQAALTGGMNVNELLAGFGKYIG